MYLDQYLTVKEVAELCGVTERTIQRRIAQGEFGDIKEINANQGKGGISYRIPLSGLPAAIIDKYIGNHPKEPKKDFRYYTDKQRDAAYQKRNIVKEYYYFVQKLGGANTVERFLKCYHSEHPEQHVSKDQLYDWKKKWERNHDFVDLIDTRGGRNKGDSIIPDEMWNYFYALYMDQRERSIQLCYDLTKKKFQGEYETVPCYETFKCRTKQIPDSVMLAYRKGEKAVKDQITPYIGRSTANLAVNEIWQSDHKLMDVFVRDENDHPVRLWLTSWMDIRSRRIVGCFLRHGDPNTDTVLHALHIAIKNTGQIPEQLYTDNGKDYKAKSGLRLDFPESVASRLGIKKIINALPYNGQAKMIERYHRTIDDRFAKLWPSYAGKDAKERPEDLTKLPADQFPTIEEFETAFFNWLEDDYNNRKHRGTDMDGNTPNNVYNTLVQECEELDMETINHIFMKRTSRVVRQNGVSVYEKDFWHEDLIPYIGQTVQVLTEYNDIQHAIIETTDGQFICKASASVLYMYGEDSGQYEAIARKKRKANKAIRENKPKTEINIHDEIMECIKKSKMQELTHEKAAVVPKPAEEKPESNNDYTYIDPKKFLDFINRKASNE